MKLTRQKQADILELKIDGRIDAQWSDHFSDEIEDVIRNGHHNIHLEMSDVSFMSSAGVRVLMRSYKQLQAINGSLVITKPSDTVKNLLEMSGLMAMFSAKSDSEGSETVDSKKVDKGDAEFEVFKKLTDNKMTYRIVGNSKLLTDTSCEASESTRVVINKTTLAIGLGALGEDHESCKDLFGEFLAVSGSAAYLPPASGGAPDYMLTAGSFVPEVQMLYAAVCEGQFSDFIRFETGDDVSGVSLSHLTGSLLEISGHKKAAVAMLTESAGLIGASLRRSPARMTADEDVFAYPDIRKWLSFSPERVFDRSLVLVTGIISDGSDEQSDTFLRPIRGTSGPAAHFHAAAFSYEPITRGLLDLDKTLMSIFEKEALQGVMHLLSDDRDDATVLESEFKRGAIWMGGIE
jgi:anti-anti-sigma factor